MPYWLQFPELTAGESRTPYRQRGLAIHLPRQAVQGGLQAGSHGVVPLPLRS